MEVEGVVGKGKKIMSCHSDDLHTSHSRLASIELRHIYDTVTPNDCPKVKLCFMFRSDSGNIFK